MRMIPVLIFSTVLLGGQWARAEVSCQQVFAEKTAGAEPDFGTLRADFEHSRNYSKELTQFGDIKDQSALGTCHLYSWSASLEQSYLQRTGKKIKISGRHLTLMHWIDSAFRTLKSEDPKAEIQLGANPIFSRFQVLRFGAMPDAAFKPARDFDKPPLSGRLETYVQNIVDRAKFDLKSTGDSGKRIAILQRAQADILQIFNDVVGNIPTTFSYDGKSYDPRSFAKEMFPELTKPIVFMAIKGDRDAEDVRTDINPNFMLFETSIDRLENTVKELIDKGQAVYLGYQHEASFVDKETGTMTLAGFHFPTNARPLSRRQREWSERNGGGHAVQIVGYDLDPKTGKIIKFKIKNSWGEKAGDNGYYHMYVDYFRAYARGITFYKGAVKLPAAFKTPVQQDLPF